MRPINLKKVLNRFEKTSARRLFRYVVAAFCYSLMDSTDGRFRMADPKEISFQDIARISRLTEPPNSGSSAHCRFPRESGFTRNKLSNSSERNLPRLDRK